MKFNVAGKALQQQLQAVSKVINSKNALAILDNFLLRVEGDTLYITGSDSENVVTASLEIMNSEGDGMIAASAKILLDIIKEISAQPVTFCVNDKTFEIDVRFLTGHFNFMGVDPREYPTRTEHAPEAVSFKASATVVQKGIDKTIYAVSSEQIRPIMTGIFWDIHPEDITFVSSDTHKLVRYINRECAPGLEASFIMPAKPAGILRGLLNKEDGEIEVTMDAKSATFKWGVYELSCRLIKGTYPNYNRVIPSSSPYKLTVDRSSLINALRRVSLFASKASSLVRMVIGESEIKLSSQDLDYATKADETVTADYQGNPLTIGFNAVYTIEVLNNLPGDMTLIELSDPARPGVFQPLVQEEGEDIVTIEMPMQVLE